MAKVRLLTYPSRKVLEAWRLLRRRTKIGKPLFRGKIIKEDLEHYRSEANYLKREIKLRLTAGDDSRAQELFKEYTWVNHLIESFSNKLASLPKKRMKGWRAGVRVLMAGSTARKKLRAIKKIRQEKKSK